MMEIFRQLIRGNNNNVAGRDLNIFKYNPYPIRFFEQDIKEVILCFSQEVDEIANVIENAIDLERPKIEKKNEINKLSETYFEHIKEVSLNSFDKITAFLEHPNNKKYLSKYLSTAKELNNKIKCHRNEFEEFEKIFDIIYTYIVERCDYNLNFDKNLIWVFLHYMYYRCEIGEKYVEAT